MAKQYRYIFQHIIYQRGIDGVIIDWFKNKYEIIARHAAEAHNQVPFGSILLFVKSIDGDEVLHDFTEPSNSDESMRLRKKLKERGRTGLTPIEYEDAIHFGLIQ